jgi:hypothetical protein
MKNGLWILLSLTLLLTSSTFASHFTACQGKYALCTTASCKPVPGKKGLVSCDCDVKTGYSASTKACQEVKKTDKGQLIYSRYYPIKSYVRCSNNRPWAWCLDKPCIIDKNNPSKAACTCSLVKDQGDYIIVTDTYSKSACTTGIISSATVKDDEQITDFLKTQEALPPFPVNVLNPQ